MRASLQLSITGFLALIIGASAFAVATGASAAELRSGTYVGELASSTPTNLSPSGGGTVEYPVEPIALTWDAVPGADNYEVEVVPDASGYCDTSSAFDPDIIVAMTTTQDTGFLPNMFEDKSGKKIASGDYCWHVRAANDGATPGEWSPAARFSVTRTVVPINLRFYNDHDGSVPRTPADSDFAAGSKVTRNSGYLSWDPVAGAKTYDVQVATSQSFAGTSLRLWVNNQVSTNVMLPQMYDEDSYYWRVRSSGGPWSAPHPFQVRRFNSTWLQSSNKYPAYNALTNDYKVGWDPVPGASYYEVQATTTASCFWDNADPTNAPAPWGANGLYDASECRLSSDQPTDVTTINNWATARMLISDQVRANIAADCSDDESTCAHDLPVSTNPVFWRVRPVWKRTAAHETYWNLDSDRIMYGAWLQDSAVPRPNMFRVERASTYDSVAALHARCTETPDTNPITSNECLRLKPGGMSASKQSEKDSTTLQLPVLEWSAVDGRGTATGPGSYWVQVARDPFFNKIVHEVQGQKSALSIPELSYSMPKGLPDDEDGYWWRVVPCQSLDSSSHCDRYYYEGASGLSFRAGGPYYDGAEPQTFRKNVEMTTAVSSTGNATPLLSVAGANAATPDDWSRGVQGAEYYQFEISRSPVFAEVVEQGPRINLIDTSVPRIQPHFKTDGTKSAQLAGGRWYWRARGVDHNDVAGGWSATSQFQVGLAAPRVTGGNGAIGAGVVGTWEPVNGATSYVVEYGTSANFSGSTTKVVTGQLAFRIPSTLLGTVYWRVRAETSGQDLDETGTSTKDVSVAGTWSAVNSSTIVPQTRLRYGTSTETAKAGSKVTFQGQLSVSGSNVNGQTVQLQRKTTACNGAGSYVTIAKGRTTGDGTASMAAAVLQNACYRFTHAGSTALYSAPFAVNVTPVFKAKVTKRKLSRGTKSCIKMQSNRVVNGVLTFQYKKATKGAKWTTIQSGRIRNFKKAKTLCFKIPVAGKLTVSAAFSGMNHPTGKWSQYADTTVPLGKFVVNNVWVKKKR